jgi:predicted alpha/beta-hydrolase family hydrolase
VIVDLVQVRTADGLRLDGALVAGSPAAAECPLDALLLVHGTGANFYASSLLEAIAQHFAGRGIAALLANTRGRDLLYTAATSDGPRRMGAACERVDDCRIDLAAWVGWLRERGHRRVGLIGHSLGAIKGVYALAQPDPPPTICLCALSPARLSHDYFLGGPNGDEFRRTFERAQRLVDDGCGETLMEVQFPIPYVVTAAGYLDKYGPGERFNVLSHVGKLRQPTLFTFGSAEVRNHVAFRGLPEAIEAAAGPGGNVRVAVVAGGDHVYSGLRAELIGRIEGWLRRLPGD